MSDITREEFNQSLERIHTRVDSIAETGTRIETSAKNMEKMVDKIHECMYGNGTKNGLLVKVSNLCSRLKIHEWALAMIIISIFGVAFFIIRESLVK